MFLFLFPLLAGPERLSTLHVSANEFGPVFFFFSSLHQTATLCLLIHAHCSRKRGLNLGFKKHSFLTRICNQFRRIEEVVDARVHLAGRVDHRLIPASSGTDFCVYLDGEEVAHPIPSFSFLSQQSHEDRILDWTKPTLSFSYFQIHRA